MKKITGILAIAALLISSTSNLQAKTSIETNSSKRRASTENRQVSGFKGISSSGSYDVKVTMGNTESLKIEGDEELLKEIETVVEDGILKIRTKKHSSNWNWKKGWGKVTVYIHAKSLNNITLSGSGNIRIEGTVKATKLTNSVSGSGNIFLNVQADEYISNISGSGEINIGGNANKAMIKVSGSGSFAGKSFSADIADVKVSGSGNVHIKADKTLNAAVSGSGNIRYSGNPQVSKTKSGSGNISRM
ncbi:MAG: head GIN domain-containing protein [Daejeonella sp.]